MKKVENTVMLVRMLRQKNFLYTTGRVHWYSHFGKYLSFYYRNPCRYASNDIQNYSYNYENIISSLLKL